MSNKESKKEVGVVPTLHQLVEEGEKMLGIPKGSSERRSSLSIEDLGLQPFSPEDIKFLTMQDKINREREAEERDIKQLFGIHCLTPPPNRNPFRPTTLNPSVSEATTSKPHPILPPQRKTLPESPMKAHCSKSIPIIGGDWSWYTDYENFRKAPSRPLRSSSIGTRSRRLQIDPPRQPFDASICQICMKPKKPCRAQAKKTIGPPAPFTVGGIVVPAITVDEGSPSPQRKDICTCAISGLLEF